jgi:amicoumacin kinase
MEKAVSTLLTDTIIQEAAKCFGATSSSYHLISDVENFVYEYQRGNMPCILRITHHSHRTWYEIMGELDWIHYLSNHGVAVPYVLRSDKGALIETITGTHWCFFVTAFRKIQGTSLLEADVCPSSVYTEWGRVMGKMHRLAQHYHPRESSWRRPAWQENDLLVKRSGYLAGQPHILKKIQDILNQVLQLPQDPKAYGLIHADFTDVNYYLHDGQIIVFDFDDSEYHWFAYDIAVVLHDTLPWLPHRGMTLDEFVRFFWTHFYTGYVSEHSLATYWLQQLPLFLKLREMMIYLFFHKKWELNALTERQQTLLTSYKANIEHDIRKYNIHFVEDVG